MDYALRGGPSGPHAEISAIPGAFLAIAAIRAPEVGGDIEQNKAHQPDQQHHGVHFSILSRPFTRTGPFCGQISVPKGPYQRQHGGKSGESSSEGGDSAASRCRHPSSPAPASPGGGPQSAQTRYPIPRKSACCPLRGRHRPPARRRRKRSGDVAQMESACQELPWIGRRHTAPRDEGETGVSDRFSGSGIHLPARLMERAFAPNVRPNRHGRLPK